jgi:hypothetical protein
VLVLDGDPVLGGGLQADLRILNAGIGIRNAHAACQTPHGTFFLGTDGNLWLIPPGAQTMLAVGDPILNHLAINNLTYELDEASHTTGSLVWFPPYLYIYPGGESGWGYLAEPNGNDIKFWGPIRLSGFQAREAIIRTPNFYSRHFMAHPIPGGYTVLPSHVSTVVHSVNIDPVMFGSNRVYKQLRFDTSTQAVGAYPDGASNGRNAEIHTGLIQVPGHRVQATRIFVEMLRPPETISGMVPVTWSVTATDETGFVVQCLHNPNLGPAAGTNQQAQIATQQWVVPPMPASRAVRVSVFPTIPEADLALVRLFVEIHMTPALF